jgi:DNA-binding transcriptional LysR family regulator
MTTARLPSLNGLRAFEAAARHLSFTQAASELNVTQTAISHQIKRLEEELGVRLFVRQNRALTLTPEAKDYLPGIRAAFNDLRLATDRLLRKDDDHVLTVSTLASLAAKWLLPRLTAFQEAHPGIDVHITTSTSLIDFQLMCRCAIRYGRGQWLGVRADWLMADELFPVCSPALLNGNKPKCLKTSGSRAAAHQQRQQRRLAAVADGGRSPTNLPNSRTLPSTSLDRRPRLTASRGHGRTAYARRQGPSGRSLQDHAADRRRILSGLARGQDRPAKTLRVPAMADCIGAEQALTLQKFRDTNRMRHRRNP